MTEIIWPKKTREYHTNHFNSTIWNDFKFRDDDVIISTYGKSGTTWVQQIVSQLIFNGQEGLPVAEMSPWMDLRIPPPHIKLEAVESQTHRRFIKTHLPVDGLVYSPKAKYIYIARDGRDVVWSLYNHHYNANEKWYDALNNEPGLVGPKIGPPAENVKQSYLDWLEKDGYPWWSYWDNINSWWSIRELPNLLMLNFVSLKKDLEGEIRNIAAYLDITIDESKWDEIVEHCSFDYMKRNSTLSVPLGGIFWDGGSETFIHKGKNGRWRDILTDEESKRYETLAYEKLGSACSEWLATGDSSLLK